MNHIDIDIAQELELVRAAIRRSKELGAMGIIPDPTHREQMEDRLQFLLAEQAREEHDGICDYGNVVIDKLCPMHYDEMYARWPLSHGRSGQYEQYQSDPGCDGDPHTGGTCGDSSHRCQRVECCGYSDDWYTRQQQRANQSRKLRALVALREKVPPRYVPDHWASDGDALPF